MKFLYFFLSPLNLFWLSVCLALFFLWVNKKTQARAFLVFALSWLFLIAVSPLSQLMMFKLERGFATGQLDGVSTDSPVNILVLGAGHSISPELPELGQLSGMALSRLTEGIRLYHEFPASKLVLSGHSSTGRMTQAEMLAAAAVSLGVDAEDTIQLRSGGNTLQEINAYKKRFTNNAPFILVTSAFHMSRAMQVCDRYRLNAIPAPTDYQIKLDDLNSPLDFKPSGAKIEMAQIVFHEWAGMVQLHTLPLVSE